MKTTGVTEKIQQLAEELRAAGWRFAFFAEKEPEEQQPGVMIRALYAKTPQNMAQMMTDHYLDMGLQTPGKSVRAEELAWMTAVEYAKHDLESARREQKMSK